MTKEQSRTASAGQAVGLGAGERLVVKDVTTDTDGSTHVRYDRTFDGLRVIGGDLVSHRDRSGRVKAVSWGSTRTVAVASTKPRLSLASANRAGAKKAGITQATTSGTKADLVVYAGGSSVKAKPKLAYDVLTAGVLADQTPSRLHTIVDASTGATLASFDEIQKATGHGVLVGTVSISTTAGTRWSMRDTVGNYTTDLKGVASDTLAGTTFTDVDNNWGNGAAEAQARAGVDAHYGAGKTFAYFKNILGRNGIKGNGVGARSRVHYGSAYDNAFWDGTQMTYGDGPGNAHPLTALDIAGHEMTHGVTEYTAGLVYQGESGGLNEATSDIFGTAVEWYANNPADRPDYLIGEKIDGTPFRYMDRPSRDGGSPDCWSPTLGELEVHSSSGPLNHWFYLASEGSGAKVINGVSYDSPTCNASIVNPIGRDKAAKIWYRALTTYLTSTNGYAVAREAAIQSAKDLYGATSTECKVIVASFSAIGVPAGVATCSTPPPTPPAGSNLLLNPGFESGNTDWSATPYVIDQWGPPRSGAWSALLGGYGGVHDDSFSQMLTIPADSRATLSYYVKIETDEAPGSVAFDTMTVRAGSTVLQTLSNVNAAAGYQRKTVDLSAFSGRTISLSFMGSEDSSLMTSFVVDDTVVTVPVTAGVTRLSDFNRDGLTDLIARDTAGILWLYPGNGAGGFKVRQQMGTGWAAVTAIATTGDVTGDGNADILARDSAGLLWLYPGNGASGLSGRRQIGSGWNGYTITGAANMNGADQPDLLARDAAGVLWLYPLSGNAVFGPRTKVGIGWNGYTLLGPGDFSGDGLADIVSRDGGGSLWLYRGNGAGRVAARTLVSTGWQGMSLVTPGNWNRAGGNDLLARDAAGRLWFCPGDNAARFALRRQVGSGWQTMTYIG